MTKGLLHFQEIRQVVPREEFLERNLYLAIRELTKTDHGRMLTLEEAAYRMLSYHTMQFGVSIVRVANVDKDGKPFVHPSFVTSLFAGVRKRMETFADVLVEGDRFEHFYNPRTFEGTELFYVPQTAFVQNMVVIQHHFQRNQKAAIGLQA